MSKSRIIAMITFVVWLASSVIVTAKMTEPYNFLVQEGSSGIAVGVFSILLGFFWSGGMIALVMVCSIVLITIFVGIFFGKGPAKMD